MQPSKESFMQYLRQYTLKYCDDLGETVMGRIQLSRRRILLNPKNNVHENIETVVHEVLHHYTILECSTLPPEYEIERMTKEYLAKNPTIIKDIISWLACNNHRHIDDILFGESFDGQEDELITKARKEFWHNEAEHYDGYGYTIRCNSINKAEERFINWRLEEYLKLAGGFEE